jgi:protein TonB
MTLHNTKATRQGQFHTASLWAGVAAIVAGCASPPPLPPPPAPAPVVAPPVAPVPAPPQVAPPKNVSRAGNLQEYRPDAAAHIYKNNSHRIFTGKMPPLLYAVGVLETDNDARGMVTSVRWMRAPSHAPEVMAEIERTVRRAAPFPAPSRMGKVTYTDTWLWHKSGQFQLHTLSEGQY